MGPRLGGRYELESVLGAGAMARVWRATDLVLGRAVAVKELDPVLARDPEYVERFSQEARNAAMLPAHPGIVTIFDSGAQDATVFLVMELVDGCTLAEELARHGALDPSEACRIAAAVGRALAVAHRAGLVHRDVKPGNIMLTGAGGVKVVDFGIAHAQSGDALTRTGAVLGSPAYMAPEQITGAAVDGRADLYALGVVLFQMLTGTPPFAGDDSYTVLHRHLGEIPPPPSALRPGLPAALDQAVARLVAKDPAARPAQAEQAAQLIANADPALPPSDIVSTRAVSALDTHGTQVPSGPSLARRTAPASSGRPAARRPDVLVVSGVALLAAAGIGMWALAHGGPSPASAGTSTTPGTRAAATSVVSQIVLPTQAASPTSSPSPSQSPSSPSSPSATATPTSPAHAIDALRSVIAAQTAAGELAANAQNNLTNQVQNLQHIVTQAQIQASQKPQNQTLNQQNEDHQLSDEIRNLRRELANLVQQGNATPAASTAINNALDQLQQTLA